MKFLMYTAVVIAVVAFNSQVTAQDKAAIAEAAGIPVVPVSVLTDNVPKISTKTKAKEGDINTSRTTVDERTVITMSPGVNQIVTVAVGHPNRIVTPFAEPEVTSTTLRQGTDGTCGEVCIKDNVVYVATDAKYPVTMFITEKGSEARALSLTMVPKKIPPREIFLKLEDGIVALGGYRSKAAERWETSQPYIETVRTVFRDLALGEVPQGYTLHRSKPGMRLPTCNQNNLRFDFEDGQYLNGHHLTVFVGVAINTGINPVEFRESNCGAWDVAAVSSWPASILAPGEATEVYVARKVDTSKPTSSRRPSLVGGSR